jgi:hypothetical protein
LNERSREGSAPQHTDTIRKLERWISIVSKTLPEVIGVACMLITSSYIGDLSYDNRKYYIRRPTHAIAFGREANDSDSQINIKITSKLSVAQVDPEYEFGSTDKSGQNERKRPSTESIVSTIPEQQTNDWS